MNMTIANKTVLVTGAHPQVRSESVARAIFDGVENEDEDIFPDPMSDTMAGSWRGSVAKDHRCALGRVGGGFGVGGIRGPPVRAAGQRGRAVPGHGPDCDTRPGQVRGPSARRLCS
jgi:hypothetical protein